MVDGVGSWAVTGAVTGVLAPGILLLTRNRTGWQRLAPPAAIAGPAFVLLHGAITISLLAGFGWPAWLGLHVALLAGSLVYWLVLRRLDGAGQFLYLFLTSPLLDLAGVIIVALGQPTYGIAMIVGMLPLNAVAVFVAWRWLTEEETQAPSLGILHGIEPGEAGGPKR